MPIVVVPREDPAVVLARVEALLELPGPITHAMLREALGR